MKFTLVFKSPDVLDQINEQVKRELSFLEEDMNDDNYSEKKQVDFEDKVAECEELAKTFIDYSEYITIEFDLSSKTAKIVK